MAVTDGLGTVVKVGSAVAEVVALGEGCGGGPAVAGISKTSGLACGLQAATINTTSSSKTNHFKRITANVNGIGKGGQVANTTAGQELIWLPRMIPEILRLHAQTVGQAVDKGIIARDLIDVKDR